MRNFAHRRQPFAEVRPKLERLFARKSHVTSRDLAKITGHYNPSDALFYVRSNGIRLEAVAQLRMNAKIYRRVA